MSHGHTRSAGLRSEAGDEGPVDAARYLGALRRGGWLIALIVVPLTGTVLLLSLVLPESYRATARLVIEERAGLLERADAETTRRRLATVQALVTSRDVLSRAADDLPGETADTLEDKVSASVDDVANIIDVAATDGDARGAAAIANGVAGAFLANERAAERRRFARAKRDLLLALERLRASGGAGDEIRAIRERLSEISVSEVAAGDELQVAQAARPPAGAHAPRPLQNTIFAFFAASFLAVLAALARDHLAPRVGGPRELSRLTGLAPLAVVSGSRGRRRQARQLEEACQAVQASIRSQLSTSEHVVIVTSALPGEGGSAVTAGVGRALAEAGHRTLLVSADLRRPGLHRLLGVPRRPGLSDILVTLQHDGEDGGGTGLQRAVCIAPERSSTGDLRVLPSGSVADHPAALLSSDALQAFFDELRRSDDRYIVVEGPPLLGPIDGQLVARWADAVLVVCRLDRLTPGDAAELGDVLERLDATALGTVVIGGRGGATYSLGAPTPGGRDARVSAR